MLTWLRSTPPVILASVAVYFLAYFYVGLSSYNRPYIERLPNSEHAVQAQGSLSIEKTGRQSYEIVLSDAQGRSLPLHCDFTQFRHDCLSSIIEQAQGRELDVRYYPIETKYGYPANIVESVSFGGSVLVSRAHRQAEIEHVAKVFVPRERSAGLVQIVFALLALALVMFVIALKITYRRKYDA